MVVTEEFVPLAKGVARARGYPDLPMVIVPHPFETKTIEEVEQIALSKAEELAARLLAPRVASRSRTPS